MGGKASRDKGGRVEREIVNLLRSLHVPAERVPLSGSAGGSYSGDVLILNKFVAESKSRKDGTGFTLLYNWLGDNDMLIVKQDRKKLLAVMPLDLIPELVYHYADYIPTEEEAIQETED
jgi:hypothetical protein